MEFIWSDGGRAASGFVGSTGDCVTRAIAIGTGTNYRTVYDELGLRAHKSPRTGLPSSVAGEFLAVRGWKQVKLGSTRFNPETLPKGILVVDIAKRSGRSGHFTAVIDHVVYDTWNPAEDEYVVLAYWQPPAIEGQLQPNSSSSMLVQPTLTMSREQELTQQEFDKIFRRLRALDKTASNHASTEGEKRNALRMMQTLLLQHNLTRDDITDQNNTDLVQFARMACVLNGSRACNWEYALANYLCHHIFPLVQFYANRRGHRTKFQFYGPRQDVLNCVELFRELLLTIASSATLQFGNFTRGSGASYAEGYVWGLPREEQPAPSPPGVQASEPVSAGQLIQNRALILRQNAIRWLKDECDISLVSSTSKGRYLDDPAARGLGKQHGASHEIKMKQQPKRLN